MEIKRTGALARMGDYALDAIIERLGIMWRHADVFVGSTFFFVGVGGFNAAKYCDGNTADYLSCTRPAVYYYYSAFDIVLIILGVWFVVLWWLRSVRH